MTTTLTFSYDHRTAWRYAYNVYCAGHLLGLVYRDSDERWHVIAEDGTREGGFKTRREAAYFLDQPR